MRYALLVALAAGCASAQYTPPSGGGGAGVSSFNTRTGAVTLGSGDVTTALGFTPGTSAGAQGTGQEAGATAGTFQAGPTSDDGSTYSINGRNVTIGCTMPGGATNSACAALIDKGGQFYNVRAYGVVAGDIDTAGANSTAMLALLAAVNTAGGGTIYFPPGTYKFTSQLLFPNDGASPQPHQSNIRLTGAGGGSNWYANSTGAAPNSTILDITYQGNNGGKIASLGLGSLMVDHLQIADSGTATSFSVTGGGLTNCIVTTNVSVCTFASTLVNGAYVGADGWILSGATGSLAGLNSTTVTPTAVGSATITFAAPGVSNGTYNNSGLTLTYSAPFFLITNTTTTIEDNAFVGNGGIAQNGIVGGGTSGTVGAGINAPFQGYSLKVIHNSFTKLNRGIYARTYANDVSFQGNSFIQNTGTGSAIECDGSGNSSGAGYNSGGYYEFNTIETQAYSYPIKLTKCRNMHFMNGLFDPSAVTSYYRLQSLSTGNTIQVVDDDAPGTYPLCSDDDGGASCALTSQSGGPPRPGNSGYGTMTAEFPRGANTGCQWNSSLVTTGYPGCFTAYDFSNPKEHMSMGDLSGVGGFLDSYQVGVGPRPILLNPGGGMTQIQAGLQALGTKFTITGCSAGTTVGGSFAGTFVSGTTGACTVVITINGATGRSSTNGYACHADDQTTPANLISQSASSTTTCTVTGTTVSGDVISFMAIGY